MYEEIIEKAFNALENAYVPYSNYRVGACVLTTDGKHFIGANIENASYGLTNCAERNAIFQTYSNGYRKENIEAIAIVCEGKTLATPCGACRQVLDELIGKETPIILSNHKVQKITNIKELLPDAFSKDDL